MRIWHEELIPRLCQKHLCAMWRESLFAYAIVTGEIKDSHYNHHPALLEFIEAPTVLWLRLLKVRTEMLKRGYHPKELPRVLVGNSTLHEWQSLQEQEDIMRYKRTTIKSCRCITGEGVNIQHGL